MTKKEHTIIRAAIATKHRYGSIALTNEQVEIMEKISGQKYENTWLGRDNNSAEAHTVEPDENGEYQILIEIEEEMKKIRNSKEGKKAESAAAEKGGDLYNESLENVKEALGEDE